MQFKYWTLLGGVSLAVVLVLHLSPSGFDYYHYYDTGGRITVLRHDNASVSFVVPRRPLSGLHAELRAVMGSESSSQTYLRDCRPTSQVRVRGMTVSHNNNKMTHDDNQYWILQGLDDQGKEKTEGGDEFYVAYFDDDWERDQTDPTAVALVRDREDGTYELRFVTTPTRRHLDPNRRGIGTLHVFFQYTCGIGRLAPPSKDSWKSGGRSDRHVMAREIPEPPIDIFQPPTQYNLSDYSMVFFVGDSLFQQLVRQNKDDDSLKPGRYFRPNTLMAVPIQAHLSMETLSSEFIAHIVSRHHRDFSGEVPGGGNTRQSANMAVVMGSFVWDILASEQAAEPLESHLAACRTYVQWLRDAYPNMTLFWKSGTAVHSHRLPSDCTQVPSCNRRSKYMSSSRAETLYTAQKQLMRSLNVPFLDLYQATYLSAYRSRPGDGRHYVDDLNDQLSKFLFGLEA